MKKLPKTNPLPNNNNVENVEPQDRFLIFAQRDTRGLILRELNDRDFLVFGKVCKAFFVYMMLDQSMSTQIRRERNAYYEELERSQKGTMDITRWILWFLQCLHQAIIQSESLLETVLNKAKFWEQHSNSTVNKRQISMMNNLFDGFKGNLTSSKWAKMMKCSQDAATRDINDLIERGILIRSASGGRSTSFLLKDFPINSID